MNQQQLDIVSVAVLVATALFSPQVAAVVGPYIVILLASTIGASFALARREKGSSRWAAGLFFLRIIGLAVLLTVLVAAYAGKYLPTLQERALLAPIALMVGYIGDDWPKLLGKVMRGIFAFADFVRGNKGDTNG